MFLLFKIAMYFITLLLLKLPKMHSVRSNASIIFGFPIIRDYRIGIIFRDSQFFKSFSQRMAEIGVEAIERLTEDSGSPGT